MDFETKKQQIVFTKRSDFEKKKSKSYTLKKIHGKKITMFFCNDCSKYQPTTRTISRRLKIPIE